MSEKIKGILLFDGVCNLCNGMVQFIIKRDTGGKFKFASLQSVAGQEILKKLGLSVDAFESFVYVKAGKYELKSNAALHVLKDLGGAWKMLYGFKIIPRPVRDFFYDLVAKSRYSIFGKRDSCMVPTSSLAERFL